MYERAIDPLTGQESAIVRDGKVWIPFDPENTDYQAFLAWKDQGNIPGLFTPPQGGVTPNGEAR